MNLTQQNIHLIMTSLSVMDKWLLSRLNSTVKEVDDNLAAYRIPETARALTGAL